MATFRVKETFHLQGRGFCLVGDILEGVIRIGDDVLPSGAATANPERIAGVEFVDNIRDRKSWIALVVADPDGERKVELTGLFPSGNVITVVSKSDRD